MVTGDAYDEAVALAHENPRLGVGLHLTLICGRACLASQEIPGLATNHGLFPDNPVDAGVKYFFKQSLRPQLEREIAAQIRKFETTGLGLGPREWPPQLASAPDHLSDSGAAGQGLGHHSPSADPRSALDQPEPGPRTLGLPAAATPWCLVCSRVGPNPALRREQIGHTSVVFGLLQTGRVTERYLLDLLPRLPAGDSELYSHPCVEKFNG